MEKKLCSEHLQNNTETKNSIDSTNNTYATVASALQSLSKSMSKTNGPIFQNVSNIPSRYLFFKSDLHIIKYKYIHFQ